MWEIYVTAKISQSLSKRVAPLVICIHWASLIISCWASLIISCKIRSIRAFQSKKWYSPRESRARNLCRAFEFQVIILLARDRGPIQCEFLVPNREYAGECRVESILHLRLLHTRSFEYSTDKFESFQNSATASKPQEALPCALHNVQTISTGRTSYQSCSGARACWAHQECAIKRHLFSLNIECVQDFNIFW